MTSEEAIKLLQTIEEDGRNVTSDHIVALDIAIRALEELHREKEQAYYCGYEDGRKSEWTAVAESENNK
jgi:hypothetical protein